MARDLSSTKSNVMRHFAAGVRAILDRKGLKQIDLARGIGEEPGNLSNWLTGRALADAVAIVKIADFLQVPIDELFGRPSPYADVIAQVRKQARRVLEIADGAPRSQSQKP
jgi:transcriptional regulator with XRE-family HTH domain